MQKIVGLAFDGGAYRLEGHGFSHTMTPCHEGTVISLQRANAFLWGGGLQVETYLQIPNPKDPAHPTFALVCVERVPIAPVTLPSAK